MRKHNDSTISTSLKSKGTDSANLIRVPFQGLVYRAVIVLCQQPNKEHPLVPAVVLGKSLHLNSYTN